MAKLKLLEALKKRFSNPEDALAALGLDAAEIALDAAIPKPKENDIMTTTKPKKWSPTALVAMGTLQNYLHPRLAQDSAIDLRPILRDVTAKNFASRRPYITTEIRRAVVGNLAADADVEDLPEIIDQIEGLAAAASEAVGDPSPDGENPMADPVEEEDAVMGDPDVDDDGVPDAVETGEVDANEIEDFLRDKLSPADLDTVTAMMNAAKAGGAVDADPDEDDKNKEPAMDKKAMDAAIRTAVDAAVARVERKHNAVAEAQRIVRPYVGDLSVAFDSADQVYRHTLTALGVPCKDVHPDALPAILRAQPLPGARPKEHRLAQDAAAAKGFSERFPSAGRIRSMN